MADMEADLSLDALGKSGWERGPEFLAFRRSLAFREFLEK
jgi:hypothetical protein